MIHVTATYENITILAQDNENTMEVTAIDTYNEKQDSGRFTCPQFAALMFLMTAGDDGEELMTKMAYEIVEPLIQGWKVRPIP